MSAAMMMMMSVSKPNAAGGTIMEDDFTGTPSSAIKGRTPDTNNTEGSTWANSDGAQSPGTTDGNTWLTNPAAYYARYAVSSRKNFTLAVDCLVPAGGYLNVYVRDDGGTNLNWNNYLVQLSRDAANINVYKFTAGSAGSALLTVSTSAWAADAISKLGIVLGSDDSMQLQVNGSNAGGSITLAYTTPSFRIGGETSGTNPIYITHVKAS